MERSSVIAKLRYMLGVTIFGSREKEAIGAAADMLEADEKRSGDWLRDTSEAAVKARTDERERIRAALLTKVREIAYHVTTCGTWALWRTDTEQIIAEVCDRTRGEE